MKKPIWQFTRQQALIALVLIMAMRMFGLFVAIPVISLHASFLLTENFDHSPASPGLWIGLVMGGYGLTQLIVQIPSGILSDKIGRRPVIILGFIIFIVGSLICEFSTNIYLLALGRAVQGIGAVSAATTAMIADLATPDTRMRWMAAVGGLIGLSFIGGIVLGPKLYGLFYNQGFFLIPAYLSLFSIALLAFFPKVKTALEEQKEEAHRPSVARPHSPDTIRISENGDNDDNGDADKKDKESTIQSDTDAPAPHSWQEVLKYPPLIQLNIGVLCLHAAMVGVFVALPMVLLNVHHINANDQWWFYLYCVPPSLIAAGVIIWKTERGKNSTKTLPAMVLMLFFSIWTLSTLYHQLLSLLIGFFVYFVAFNTLEAMQPALVGARVSTSVRGTAMGIYHAFQSLGLFIGGLVSGYLLHKKGIMAVFQFNAAIVALWLGLVLYAQLRLLEDEENALPKA